jgi:hypothetical protein
MVCIRTRSEVGARSAQVFAETCTDGKSVRADRRLRTDDEAIRTQATIFEEAIFLILK